MFGLSKPMTIPNADEALPGRDTPIDVVRPHAVHGRGIRAPFPDGMESVLLGMGVFGGWNGCFGSWMVFGRLRWGMGAVLRLTLVMRRSVRDARGYGIGGSCL